MIKVTVIGAQNDRYLNRTKNGHFDLKINGHFGHITFIHISWNDYQNDRHSQQ